MHPDEARTLMQNLGAAVQLLVHAELVEETAAELVAVLSALDVAVDEQFVRTGAVLHDIGKTVHAEELVGAGTEHAEVGERVLLEHGIDGRLARVSRTHHYWAKCGDCTLEELVVALADSLWKGRRDAALEARFALAASTRTNLSPDRVTRSLSDRFATIAAQGDERLARALL